MARHARFAFAMAAIKDYYAIFSRYYADALRYFHTRHYGFTLPLSFRLLFFDFLRFARFTTPLIIVSSDIIDDAFDAAISLIFRFSIFADYFAYFFA